MVDRGNFDSSGNSVRDAKVYNYFAGGPLAERSVRYIYIYPLRWQYAAMRVDVMVVDPHVVTQDKPLIRCGDLGTGHVITSTNTTSTTGGASTTGVQSTTVAPSTSSSAAQSSTT